MGIEEIVYVTSTLLTIIGALNWGAYALGNNLVEKIGNKNIKNSIYYLIAISGLVSLVFLIRYKGSKKYGYSSKTSNSKTLKSGRPRPWEDDWCNTRTCLTGYTGSGSDCRLTDSDPVSLDNCPDDMYFKDNRCTIKGCIEVTNPNK